VTPVVKLPSSCKGQGYREKENLVPFFSESFYVQPDRREEAKAVLADAASRGVTLLLPQDHIIAKELKAGTTSSATSGRKIPTDQLGVDIGPQSIRTFRAALKNAKTILWNGPMGVFEIPPFDQGTRALAEAGCRNLKL
jgi:3-phosphoglycerate kinase